jgi:hypothetical protein
VDRRGATVTERVDTLRALWRSLQREAQVLRVRPDTLAQQLANRLGGSGPPDLVAGLFDHLSMRSAVDKRSWLRVVRRPDWADRTVAVMPGHTDWITDCAFAAGGSAIVSASRDG